MVVITIAISAQDITSLPFTSVFYISLHRFPKTLSMKKNKYIGSRTLLSAKSQILLWFHVKVLL